MEFMKINELRAQRFRLVGVLTFAALATACSASVGLPLGGHIQVSTGATVAAAPTATLKPAIATVPMTSPVVGIATAEDLQSQYVRVVQLLGPSVVQIETPNGLGSGIVFDSLGDIVTNAHVVESFTSFAVTYGSGSQVAATLVGVDVQQDLAVIRVAGSAGLTPAAFADSSQLQVGDIVMALGSPYGLQGSVTQGLVSALNRDIPESRRVTLTGLIQTSAAINPGNSGGALADLSGQVVGIPTLGAGGGSGIGFAIPSSNVVAVAQRLIRAGV